MIKMLLLLLTLIGSVGGCTYTRSVTQTNLPVDRSRPVQAVVKKYIILGFNFDNDDVLQLRNQLREQCPGGRVTGVLTKDLRTMYLLFFFWARESIASGYCVKNVTADVDSGARIPDVYAGLEQNGGRP